MLKKVAAFCPCSKNLPKAEVNNFGLTPLAEEISKHPSIDSVVCILVFMFIKIYSEGAGEVAQRLRALATLPKVFFLQKQPTCIYLIYIVRA